MLRIVCKFLGNGKEIGILRGNVEKFWENFVNILENYEIFNSFQIKFVEIFY